MQDKTILIKNIDKLLPQTQCEKCDYPGCEPYATAIINNQEKINKCEPGGQITANAIADLVKTERLVVAKPPGNKTIAVIDESICVGCTICLKYCPTDAIIGANKLMHTVITDECTGCELCIAPCPMDCIEMVELEERIPTWSIDNEIVKEKADKARIRFNNHKTRLHLEEEEKIKRHKQAKNLTIKSEIMASIERAKQKKALKNNNSSKPGDK